MVFNIIFKVLSFLLLVTTFTVAENVDECENLQTYFVNSEVQIIIINYCETNDGKISKLEVERNGDYELSEEELLKVLSYKDVVSLELKGFIVTQTLIDELAEFSNIEELITIHTSFENEDLDYSPLESLNGQLIHLHLAYNWYDGNIFKKLKFLTELKKITFFDENISKDHIKAISKFSNLDELNLISWNGFTDDISFSRLKNLTKLNSVGIVVYGGKLKKNMINVFTTIKRLYLEEVDLSQTNIDELSKLTNLEELKISDNTFPQSLNYNKLKKLTKLTSFEIDSRDIYEKFEEIPEFIYSFTNLKRLAMINQNIEIIPKKLSNLTNLEYLDLHNNKIDSDLPESLNSLSNLNYIDLRGNRNVKGKTLINDKLEYCYYEGNYSLCKAKSISCLENSGVNFTECHEDDYVSTNGQCGKGHGRCPSGKCCSKYGWCGTTENFCSTSAGCQSEFGECHGETLTPTIKCGKKEGQCPHGQCCGKDGYCGTGEDYCSIDNGCQSKFGNCYADVPISINGRCGRGKGRCTAGHCCSKHGWCGTSEAHCSVSAGCQSEFGKCN